MTKQNAKDSEVSISAMSIAYSVYRASQRKRYGNFFSDQEKKYWELIAVPAMKAFPDDMPSGKLLKGVVLQPRKAQTMFFHNNLLPRYDELFMVRKLMIRSKIDEAIANGAEQIIILGGGYDPRGLIVAENNPQVTVFELDRGFTRENKLKVVKDISGKEINEISEQLTRIDNNFVSLNCDLEQIPMDELLIKHGFDPKKQTIIIAEGVTTYLNEQSNRAFLTAVRRLMLHDKSDAFVGYIEKISCLEGMAKEAHQEHNEQFKFALPKKQVLLFINNFELKVTAKITPSDLLEKIDPQVTVTYREGAYPVEYYYLMSVTAEQHYINLDDVPKLSITVPDIQTKEPYNAHK